MSRFIIRIRSDNPLTASHQDIYPSHASREEAEAHILKMKSWNPHVDPSRHEVVEQENGMGTATISQREALEHLIKYDAAYSASGRHR
jgi:hypothetical protein